MPNTYLAHHGILGQKWGVRRFQNEDGTLTAAGKERLHKDIHKAYTTNTDTLSFGRSLSSAKSIRKLTRKNPNRRELQKDLRDVKKEREALDHTNEYANLEAMDAVGGKMFIDILSSGDDKALATYMTVGAEAAAAYGKLHGDRLNVSLKKAYEASKKYEKEVTDLINSAINDVKDIPVSYASALAFDLRTNTMRQQTLGELTINALLSESGAIELERIMQDIARQKRNEASK